MIRHIFIISILFLIWTTVHGFVNAVETTKSDSVSSSGIVVEGASLPLSRGEILKFYTDQKWYEYKTTTFITEFENTGNANLHPQGNIVIKNWFRKEIGRIPTNQYGIVVKPDGKAIFKDFFGSDKIINLIGFGKYSAQLSLSYGQEKALVKTLSYWVIPWRLIIIILIYIFVYIMKILLDRERVGVRYHKMRFKPVR